MSEIWPVMNSRLLLSGDDESVLTQYLSGRAGGRRDHRRSREREEAGGRGAARAMGRVARRRAAPPPEEVEHLRVERRLEERHVEPEGGKAGGASAGWPLRGAKNAL